MSSRADVADAVRRRCGMGSFSRLTTAWLQVSWIQAWREAGHTIFFLKPGWTNLAFWDQANKFTKCFPQMVKAAERAERGSAFIVSVNGKVDKLG